MKTKNFIKIALLFTVIFIAGCAQSQELSNSDLMMVAHCLEMEMPECEEYENVELNEDQIKNLCSMMPNMEICSTEKEHMMSEMPMHNSKDSSDKFKRDIVGLEYAKESQVYNLEDGDNIDLSIDIVKKEIQGKEIRMFGYDGQIPGPILKAKQGSSVYVNVTNNLDVETTVHWHGLRLENEFDGVPGYTMDVQEPGDSFEYKLDFVDEGIYWYHPHVREDYQQELGLYGNMLVNPMYDDYYNNVNLEVPLILDDILIVDGDIEPFYKEHGTKTLMGRFGNVMLINGDENYNLEINKGDVIRFYLTSVANTRMFNISIPGAQIKLVGADIGSYEKEEYVDSIIIAPAQRYTIEAYFENTGEHEIKHINPHSEYLMGTVNVLDSNSVNDYSNEFLSLRENEYVKEDISNFKEYFEKDVDVNIELSIDMMGMGSSMLNGLDREQRVEHCEMMPNMIECDSYLGDDGEEHMMKIEWEDEMQMMNSMSTSESITWILRDSQSKKENMDIDLDFKVGDKVKIRLFNDPNSMHPMQHPIHFHGQRFLVLERDNVKNENLVWKDTVLVPVGETVDLLLDVTNPGEWMAHCHIAEHLEAGMMMSFKVSGDLDNEK